MANKKKKEITSELLELIYKPIPPDDSADDKYATRLTETQYYTDLDIPFKLDKNGKVVLKEEPPTDKAKRAFEMVLETRKFEIELYWKRATYFWAFSVSIFAAFFIIKEKKLVNQEFMIICLGIIVSFAWHFTNIGSKTWQRHWEKHMDLMENHFIGPIYKTVNSNITYSVTKINEIISFTFIFSWLMLGLDYIFTNLCFSLSPDCGTIDIRFIILVIATILIVTSMVFGYGRGRFQSQDVKMYRRHFNFKNFK